MTHSTEPWKLEPSGGLDEAHCVDANGKFIAGYSSSEGSIDLNDPNWQRIIACVNACQGLSTESLQMVAQGKACITTGRLGQHLVTTWPITEPATILSQAEIPGLRQ